MTRRGRLLFALLSGCLAFQGGELLLASHRAALHWFADAGWTLVSLAAGLKCLQTARRHERPHLRRAWMLFGAGCLSWFGGMLVWNWHELVLGEVTPFPSLGEIGFFGIVPLMVVGFFFYGAQEPSALLTWKRIGDLLIASTTMVAVGVLILYDDVRGTDADTFYMLMALGHPLASLTGVLFGLISLWQRSWGRNHWILLLLVVAMAILGGVTTLYAHSLLLRDYRVGHSLDVFWVLTFVCVIWAAYEEDWLAAWERDETDAPANSTFGALVLDALVPGASMFAVVVTCALFRDHWSSELAPVYLGLGLVASAGLGLRAVGVQRLERSLLEDAQREERRFRRLVRDAPVGIGLASPDGVVVPQNRVFERIIGPEGVSQSEDADWVTSGIADRVAGAMSSEMRTTTEHLLPSTRRRVRVLVSPLDDGSALIILRDVTSEKALQLQLMQAQKMEAVGTLAGGIAHDFNNLLTGMLAGAGLLRKVVAHESKEGSYLELMEQSMLRAADLTKRLLTLSRKREPQIKTVRSGELVRRVAALLRQGIPESIRVEEEISGEDPVLRGDPAQLEQALLNLGINARHALGDHGRIVLRMEMEELEGDAQRPPGRYAVLSVEDDGPGVPEDLQQRIFDPFFTTKRSGEGTGLGLAMVYACAEDHGGWVALESRPSEGARFRIYLPATEQVEHDGSQEREPEFPPGRERILVVDDRDAPLLAAKAVLDRCGYDVLVAWSAEEALNRLAQSDRPIALVITDAVMPGAGGHELLTLARKQGHEMPFVLTTGYDTTPSTDGFAETIRKPYEPSALARLVRRVLDDAADESATVASA